ncbi:MucBP domain-containing protein, partial [Lachnoanaerobaculum gingivalis]
MTGVLSFILALIITFTSVPIDAHATGIGSQVTTKIRYSVGGQTTSLIGKQESYSIQTGISGTVGSYTLPYSIIYLSKDKFDAPSAADVSTANFIQGVTVDNTSDAQYYKIKVTYRQLTAGPPVTFPFRAVLKNLNVAGGEQVNIKTTFHEKDGVEIVNDNKNFTAAGYVAGIEGNDNSQANPRQMGYGETIVDADVDSTHTKFSPNYQNDITFSIMNGKKNATNGEVTVKPSEGLDKRPVRVTVTLPSTSVWDASLPNNAGWTYNSADNTITKDFTRTGYEFRPLFTIKYGTATTVGRQTFPVKTVLVNTDGSTDSTTERNGSVFKDYTYVRKLKGNKYHLRYNYAVPVKEEYKHAYLITAGQYWGTTVVQNTTTTLNTIIDEPWSPNLFTGYGIRVQNGYFDAANLALIAQNKLIGVNDDGSEEVIQTNVPYEVVNNDAAMTTDSIPIAMTPKHYKSIRLEFDNEVTISKYGEKAIGLVVETQLTPAEFTKEKNRLAANPSPSSANVTNTGKVQSYSNGVWTTISSNAVYIMREEFAQMQLDKLSQKINGNTSSNIAYTGNTMEYEMNVNYDDSYIFSEDRDVENGKLVMVVDPELNFNSITVGGTPYFSADTNPTEVANYGGTGKKAYIFDLNNFAFKKQQQAIFKRDNIKVSFTPSSSLEAGEHKVEAILSWTNNTDQANSKDPHTVFSKDTANYLDIYDSNENGSTNDRLSRIEWKFNFVPPQSVIINKVENLESEPDSAYRAKMKAEKDEIVQYRIMAYNNSNADATELNFLDIFPYAGDKNTVKDYAGNYVYRGSKFATVLQGPVTAPAGYTVYYSTDSPKGTFAENLANTWVSASGISDWSQVTMFKAIMNTGVKLAKDDKEYFTYKVKMPDTKDLDEDDTSNNSIATWYGNNIDGANEAINSKVGIYKYQVSGKAYYDVDDDGKYSTGDVLIANRPVKLLKDGNVIAETTTDANGDYTFKNIITNAGNYNVMVETLTSDTIIPNNPSTSSVIGQDFNSTESSASTLFSGQTSTWAKTDVSLTKTKTKSVKNIGLKNQTSNLTVKHIKIDDNTELIPDTTTTAGVGTPYTTAAVTTDPNYEVDTTQLPANANGTYTTTDTTVVYKYKRKNAGKVTVHHYEVGTTTELYKAPGATATGPEELDGTNKLGLSYTTQSRENDIANFELTTPAP